MGYTLWLFNIAMGNGPFIDERSAKPQLKNAIFGSYRFWDFTISFYSISWLHHPHPLANCMRKPFYTSTSRLGHLWLPCPFFSCASTVWWVSCDTCQRNCKSQLHHPFSSSETSFEFSLLEETRVSSHSDMLHAFHYSPSSAQQTIDLVQCLCLGYLHLG